MRVLYVNHTAEVSGSERSLLALLERLPEHVHACVATPPGRLAEAVSELGIPVVPIASTAGSLRLHPLHTPRAVAEMGAAALQVHRATRAHRADLVHANSIRAGIELGLARVSPAAAVVHVRDCLPPGPVSRASMRLIAATATAIVANSRYTAGTVRAGARSARVDVIHPAIDAASLDFARIDRADARARLGELGRGRVLLAVVAQLSPWKGQDTAIRTLALLREQGIDAHLLLIGSAKFLARSTRFDNPAYVAGLHRLVAETGVREHVSWMGERGDVPELMRALDVLLAPSREEPFGRVLLEAMALEVPVVATSVGGPPELIGDGREGYLAAPGQPREWARAVRLILDDPERARRLGVAARRRVTEEFAIAGHVEAVLAVYGRARAAAGRGRRERRGG